VQHVGQRALRVALPSGDAHHAVAQVDRGDHALGAEVGHDGAEDVGSVGGDGADHHLLGAAVDPGAGAGDGADAAADLHAVWPSDPRNDVRRRQLAAARTFEINHVKTRALRQIEIAQDVLRISICRHLLKVAASKTNDFALKKIDRWNHVHAMKFLKTCSPAADDFSG
jgi:hypothetical protein